MNIPEILLNTLEGLDTNDFNKFKWFLSTSVLDDFKPIPKSLLQDPLPTVTVDRLLESYCEGPAVTITLEILRRMNHNNAARMLQQTATDVTDADKLKPIERVKPAASLPPAHCAKPSVSAEHSVVLLPTLNNNMVHGALSFNFNIQH